MAIGKLIPWWMSVINIHVWFVPISGHGKKWRMWREIPVVRQDLFRPLCDSELGSFMTLEFLCSTPNKDPLHSAHVDNLVLKFFI